MLWYAIRIRSRLEFIAEQILTSHGSRVYLPVENARRRLSRVNRKLFGWVNVPMLPGYVFTSVNSPSDLNRLFGWSFVMGVVGDPATGEPRRISQAEMAHILRESQERTKRKANPIDWAPNRGQWVRIINGPFAVEGNMVKVEALIGKKAKRFFADMGGRLVIIESKNVVAA